jgi:hypothetical protein
MPSEHAARQMTVLEREFYPIIGFILVLSGCIMEIVHSNSLGLASWLIGWGLVAYALVSFIFSKKAVD